jgi:hypothetical protein
LEEAVGDLMDAEEYMESLASTFFIVRQVLTMPLEEVYRKMEIADAMGPIVDPTLYKAVMGSFQFQKEVVEAALEFKKKLQEIQARHKA